MLPEVTSMVELMSKQSSRRACESSHRTAPSASRAAKSRVPRIRRNREKPYRLRFADSPENSLQGRYPGAGYELHHAPKVAGDDELQVVLIGEVGDDGGRDDGRKSHDTAAV